MGEEDKVSMEVVEKKPYDMADRKRPRIRAKNSNLDFRGKLEPRHRTMLRYYLEGQSCKQIAREMGCSVASVQKITQREDFLLAAKEFQNELDDKFAEKEVLKTDKEAVHQKLKEEVGKNLLTLVGLRDFATSEKVKLDAAIELFHLAGFRPPDKIETDLRLDASDGLIHAINSWRRRAEEKEAKKKVDIIEVE